MTRNFLAVGLGRLKGFRTEEVADLDFQGGDVVVNVDVLRRGRAVERVGQKIADLVRFPRKITDVTGNLTNFLDPVVFDR